MAHVRKRNHPVVPGITCAMSTNRAPIRVVILGGGFGGVYTARHLERLALPGDATLDVTLVSHDNFFLFTPMLHEVAASDLDITHIVSPLRTLLRKTDGRTLYLTARTGVYRIRLNP
jgi:NADH dehydrogenase FAD-containing subunit